MTLESRIEARAVKELAKVHAPCIKHGRDGYPDRIVPYAPGRVIWMEFKQPGEKPMKNQVIRHKQLRAAGQQVEIVEDWRTALALVAAARRAIGYTKHRDK
jgi:hypothetical protein